MANSEVILGGDAWGIDFSNFTSNGGADYTNWVDIPAGESRTLTVTKKPRYVFWAMCAVGYENYIYARYIDVLNEKTIYLSKLQSATNFTVSQGTGIDSHTTITDNAVTVQNWVSSSRSIAVIVIY